MVVGDPGATLTLRAGIPLRNGRFARATPCRTICTSTKLQFIRALSRAPCRGGRSADARRRPAHRHRSNTEHGWAHLRHGDGTDQYKLALRAAGVNEPGHTEILARIAGRSGDDQFDDVRQRAPAGQVVLATIRLPLSKALTTRRRNWCSPNCKSSPTTPGAGSARRRR